MRVDACRLPTRLGLPTAIRRRSLRLRGNPLSRQRSHLCHSPAGVMDAGEPPTPPLPSPSSRKRPFCTRCSKPASVCLCSRLRCPPLDNSIGVTILQHSLEGKHALNSARVASLGLRNVSIVPVTDVLCSAIYDVRPVVRGAADSTMGGGVRPSEVGLGNISNVTALRGGVPGMEFETHSIGNRGGDGGDPHCNSEKCKSWTLTAKTKNGVISKDSTSPKGSTDSAVFVEERFGGQFQRKRSELSPNDEYPGAEEENTVVTSELYRVICSSNRLWFSIERTAKPDFSWVLGRPFGKAATLNGFVVRKLQRRQRKGSLELEEVEEFKVVMPPGSALLFPGKSSIALGAVDLEVKHLIVLDGTWDKAKRMYYENPWLQFLPHLKLELKATSLYSEVRHQPAPGCFSTIESIVYAMKALGNGMEGLDNLLDVFESMVGDQRRCKDEKFSRMA
ncbi:hypothetical protein Taro_028187, partial [Colocasia esculenta]|nr:hypothetical protein [Colocasia esculenta]